jgi:hypothetical protein
MNRGPVVGFGQCTLDILGRVDPYPPIDEKGPPV